MSVPPTPDTHPAAASVTPGGYSIERSTLGERFEPSVLDLIVGLLAPDTSATVALRTAIDAVFVDRWQATTWADLMVFTSTDVAAAFTPGPDIPVEATAPVVVKKLGYVVDFARIGALTPNTTMNDIVQSVSPSHRRATVGGLPHSPSRNLMQVFDKKAVPTIEKFNGHDEDYFTWKESTINALGTAGFSRFLDDKTVVSRHPEVAESVFYSLRGAVYGGQAQSIAQRMLDEKNLDPTDLWSALEDYYDTALNRANVVLFDIRRLLHLRLDPDNPASKFISAYRECLQRLRKNHARLSDDTDTLRALLLVAIQDDDFEMVRDSIVHKPDLSVESILTELRERETSLHQSLRDVCNGIDDRARCEKDIHGNPGLQMARFGSTTVLFFFDGTKCFFAIHPITDDELRRLPKITLTDGSVPYEPFARLRSRRRHAKEHDLFEWKRRLGFVPDHVVSRTLCATTQLVKSVESETREIMRDHFRRVFRS